MLLMLMASLLLCGCITLSATDNKTVSVSPNAGIPQNITPVPSSAASNDTALPATVKNISTATPTPMPANTTKNVSNDFAPGLPPAILFTHVPAYGSDDLLKGTVAGIDDPKNYKLAIFIDSYGWWNVPSSDQRLTNISGDGSWECDITLGGTGRMATEIDAFLVPAGFVPSMVTGRYGLPRDIRDNATAVNAVTRDRPKVTPD